MPVLKWPLPPLKATAEFLRNQEKEEGEEPQRGLTNLDGVISHPVVSFWQPPEHKRGRG